MKVPDFIGYPGKQTRAAYNATDDFDAEYDRFVDDKIVIATLKPKIAQISGDSNIFENGDAWDKYTGDLQDMKITPPNKSQIDIVISQLSPITRTYNNNYGDSKILPTGNLLGAGASELMQLAGDNTLEMEKILKENAGNDFIKNLLGKGIGKYNDVVTALGSLGREFGNNIGNSAGNMIATISSMTEQLAKSPQSKIGWPKMWSDCSFEQSYQLNTRLYCFSTENKDDYDNNIKAALMALELFVTPRSEEGALYIAPYILEFDIPGMLHFPQAYVSSLTVTEGGDQGDFAQTGRPNVVDVTMNIQNMYSIAVNTKKKGDYTYPFRPSVRKDLIGLSTGRNTGRSSSYGEGGSGRSAGANISYDKVYLDNVDDNSATSNAIQEAITPRQQQNTQQQAAAAAIADAQSKK